MTDNILKPRLVFFQRKYGKRVPDFLLTHTREHAKCLSLFFDLTVIQDDCDYQRVCDEYQPDLSLFETGPNLPDSRTLRISGVRSFPQVPKVGFINADGWSETRAATLSQMDNYGIETFFAISITAAEHTPEIADRLFIWPNFIDPEVFRDYGLPKLIPLLFTGATNAMYPWRRKLQKLLSGYYPSLICPHRGYFARQPASQSLHGEKYARTLNASSIAPACGTVAKEIVRKHFEIPGCSACLVTEDSPGLRAAGFADMKNCVFADEHDVLDKVSYLLEHPDELKAVTDAGFELVHSRHTMQQRNQIRQWLHLHKSARPHQRIIQLSPFDAPVLVDHSTGLRNSQIISNGLHLQLLHEGDEQLRKGNLERAESLYRKSLNYMPRLPEAKLRMCICSLRRGDAEAAVGWSHELVECTLAEYQAEAPDPVEWAYLIISLLCKGKLEEASRRSREYPWMCHQELDRARWAASVLLNSPHPNTDPGDGAEEARYRVSVHRVSGTTLAEWTRSLGDMLVACSQREAAEKLLRSSQNGSFEDRSSNPRANAGIGQVSTAHSDRSTSDPAESFRRRLAHSRKKQAIRSRFRHLLHSLEKRFGYFLPYHLSASKSDFLCRSLEDLARREEVRSALLIGAAQGEPRTQALLAGALANDTRPAIFCVSYNTPRHSRNRLHDLSPVQWYYLPAHSDDRDSLETTISEIKSNHGLDGFDLVFIHDSAESKHRVFSCDGEVGLLEARFVVIDNITGSMNHSNYHRLMMNSRYILADYDFDLGNGYAMFENTEVSPPRNQQRGIVVRSHPDTRTPGSR